MVTDRFHAMQVLAHHYQRILPMAGIVAFALTLSLLFIYFRDFFEELGHWGYIGMFFVMTVNNATVVFPAPGLALLAVVAPAFNPFLLGLVAGLGATIGDLVGYTLGRAGYWTVAETNLYKRVRRFREWIGPGLFVFAASPLPFDLASVFAGGVRYPLWRFFLFVGTGRVVKMTIIAVAGHYALEWLFGIFGL